MLQESEGRIKCLANGDTWVFVASGVAGSGGSREDVGRDFGGGDLLSERNARYIC